MHHDTTPVPYTLAFEPEVGARLEPAIRSAALAGQDRPVHRLVRGVWQGIRSQKLDDTITGTPSAPSWRTDEIPPSVAWKPGLKTPSFPGTITLPPPMCSWTRCEVPSRQRLQESRDSLTVVIPGNVPVGKWYVRALEETLMDCVAEEDFYAELLDRFTDLTLEPGGGLRGPAGRFAHDGGRLGQPYAA